jgi:uncharacterized membrane protein
MITRMRSCFRVVKLALCMLMLSALCTTTLFAQQSTPPKITDFEKDVMPILMAYCQKCHQGDGAKNDFHVLVLDELNSYIDASGSDSSSLWTDYLTAPPKSEDKDSLIMPPAGRLPAGELAMIKMWLDEGAVLPEKLTEAKVEPKVEQDAATKALTAAGYFHPAVIHFPIALIIVSAMAAMVSFVGYTESLKRFSLACLVFGAITAVVSAVAGWGFAMEKGYLDWQTVPDANTSEAAALLFRHRWSGVASAALASIVAIMGLASTKLNRRGHLWRIGVIVCAALVGITGHQGGEMVYGDILHAAMQKLGW